MSRKASRFDFVTSFTHAPSFSSLFFIKTPLLTHFLRRLSFEVINEWGSNASGFSLERFCVLFGQEVPLHHHTDADSCALRQVVFSISDHSLQLLIHFYKLLNWKRLKSNYL